MINCRDLCFLLKKAGFDFSAGVPCSTLGGIIACLQTDPEIPYIPAIKEEEALGIATGAYLAGRKPLVLMQNSGLGNSLGTLASLNLIYKIPLLLIVSWRGYQGKDAPEHLVMGKTTLKILEGIGIPAQVLSDDNLEEIISNSVRTIKEQCIPVSILVRRGVIS